MKNLFRKSGSKNTESEEYYEKLLKSNPKDIKNLYNYATFLEKKNEYLTAEEYYKKASELNPKYKSVKKRLSSLDNLRKKKPGKFYKYDILLKKYNVTLEEFPYDLRKLLPRITTNDPKLTYLIFSKRKFYGLNSGESFDELKPNLLKAIFEAIGSNSKIKYVDLSGNDLYKIEDPNLLKAIFEPLASDSSKVTSVDLWGNGLGYIEKIKDPKLIKKAIDISLNFLKKHNISVDDFPNNLIGVLYHTKSHLYIYY